MQARVSELMKQGAPEVGAAGKLIDNGEALPTAGTAGFAKGCLFIDTVAGANYINEGTVDSCDFKTVQTA